MGFISNLFVSGRPSKKDIIKNLAKERIRTDPLAKSMGFSESMIDSLETVELMGIPEAIVETYASSLKNGASEEAILHHIENNRSKIAVGDMPVPLNIESYIKYRIEIEHGHCTSISEQFISKAISVVRSKYGC